MTTILVVDNYDSFVFNLVQYLEQLGADCIVRRNDEITTDEVAGLGVDGVLLSPGPGTEAGKGERAHWRASSTWRVLRLPATKSSSSCWSAKPS